MKHLVKYFHAKERMEIDTVMAFKIFIVVTLRQTLTQMIQNVHSSMLNQQGDNEKKRKQTEKIVI